MNCVLNTFIELQFLFVCVCFIFWAKISLNLMGAPRTGRDTQPKIDALIEFKPTQKISAQFFLTQKISDFWRGFFKCSLIFEPNIEQMAMIEMIWQILRRNAN